MADMPRRPVSLTEQAIARIVSSDPLAGLILESALRAEPNSAQLNAALALVGPKPLVALASAHQLARTRRDRQLTAIVAEQISGDMDRVRLLAREHLAEFPDDVLVSWLSGAVPPPAVEG